MSARRPTRARRHTGVCAAPALILGLTAALALVGCAREPEPVRDSRETLGTVVTVTAYADDKAAGTAAIDDAYDAMETVEASLDAHDPSSEVARFNADPYTPKPLPQDARTVIEAVDRLDAGGRFSPSLLGVTRLYDFEGGGRVPNERELAVQVELASSFRPATRLPDGSPAPTESWSFDRLPIQPEPAPPGLDLGGAAKGLALDRASQRLKDGGVDSALLSAGSTTVAFGEKPEGEPWRIGVEDPRDPEKLVATIVAGSGVVMSTSGDYQRFFERDGRRYHHILDPADGKPAAGFRSLTVLAPEAGGVMSALDSDILSTSLFVGGLEMAEDYARTRGLGLITVDAAGEVRVVEPASGSSIRIEIADT